MRSWSVPAGRLFGVDIRIHLTFVFLLAFVWFTQSVTMGTSGRRARSGAGGHHLRLRRAA